jgi:hypothetical protein
MAALVKISRSEPRGDQILAAIAEIRNGLAVIEKFNGMRAQTIGANDGAATFAATFGVTTEPQAFSDRWAAIADKNYAGLSDFLDATIAD